MRRSAAGDAHPGGQELRHRSTKPKNFNDNMAAAQGLLSACALRE
jgi:hypothetical protein